MKLQRFLHSEQPIESLYSDFCANMLNEAMIVSKEGYKEDQQDLFMEQGLFSNSIVRKENPPLYKLCFIY